MHVAIYWIVGIYIEMAAMIIAYVLNETSYVQSIAERRSPE